MGAATGHMIIINELEGEFDWNINVFQSMCDGTRLKRHLRSVPTPFFGAFEAHALGCSMLRALHTPV